MFWNKNKIEKEVIEKLKYQQRTQEVQWLETEVELGKATLEVDLKDGRTFTIRIYGEIPNPYVHNGQDEDSRSEMREPTVALYPISAKIKAENILNNYAQNVVHGYNNNPRSFVNDEITPTESVIGEPVAFVIVSIEEFKRKVLVPTVVKKGEVK